MPKEMTELKKHKFVSTIEMPDRYTGLLSCPFCGGKAIIDPDDNCACCLNVNCMVQPKVCIDGFEGKEYWNRRTP